MKEIDEQHLDHMFPDGYMIVYFSPNTNLMYFSKNPTKSHFLASLTNMVRRYFDECKASR